MSRRLSPSKADRRARPIGLAVSLAGHLLALLVLLSPARPLPQPDDAWPPPVTVTLVAPPPPPNPAPSPSPSPAPAAAAAAQPVPAKPVPPARPLPRLPVKSRPAPPDVEPLPVSALPPAPILATVSDAQLVGAATAGSGVGAGGAGSGSGIGSGGTGQSCDMVRRLQAALRRDVEVQAAVARAHRTGGGSGRAILVWNGDWIQSPGQEGKGLAGVRQAIVMEVAFAPAACRADPMRGLVLLSLNDAPGAARLVLGSGAWRWSDLLSARRG